MQQDQDILDNISTGIIALDAQLRVIALNAAGQALLETSEARCLGSHARQLLLQPTTGCRPAAGARQQQPLSRAAISLMLLRGQEIHVDLMVTPVSGSQCGIALLVEMQAVDRLLKISREEGLIHAQETTRAVIRGLAHEIKNPLGGVRGAAQLLARELPDEELTEYTQVIIREADRLRDLVDRLLGPNQQLTSAAQYSRGPGTCAQPDHCRVQQSAHHQSRLRSQPAGVPGRSRAADPGSAEYHAQRAAGGESPEQCHITLRTRSQRQFTVAPNGTGWVAG